MLSHAAAQLVGVRMSQSANVLDFFILEANEYIDRLDVVLGATGGQGPEVAELVRPARALRGSATMSRQHRMAELATALERTVLALREGSLTWSPAVRGALVATVDDLRYLLRRTREWGDADDQRVRTRVAELESFAPVHRTPTSTPSITPGGTFLASATAEVARTLEQYVLHPTDHAALTAALGSTRTLRGVAALKDIPPTAEVVDAVERVGTAIERTAGTPSAQRLAVLSAAAAVLRRVAGEIAANTRPSAGAPDLLRFNAALAALDEGSAEADRIVPIAQLFFADAGPHVISAAPHPPTRPADRFRLEVVSQAEHLRRLVDEARAAPEVATAERLTRDLRTALRTLQATAESFDEEQVVRFASAWSEQVSASHPAALTALDAAAAVLSNPATRGDVVFARLEQLRPGPTPAPRATPDEPPQAIPADDALAEAPMPAPREPLRTPTGEQLRAFLEGGISTLEHLREQPLAPRVADPSDEVVPMEQLLYRGRAALVRAVALRDEMRGEMDGEHTTPSPEALDELFDLLDLALTE
jgi:chemotaxis protein histidine kinase CheA